MFSLVCLIVVNKHAHHKNMHTAAAPHIYFNVVVCRKHFLCFNMFYKWVLTF